MPINWDSIRSNLGGTGSPAPTTSKMNWDSVRSNLGIQTAVQPTTNKVDFNKVQQDTQHLAPSFGGWASQFLNTIPDTLKGFFSNTIQGAKSIFQDPLNIAPSTTGQGNIQFAKDFYNKTIGSVVNTAVDEKNRIGDFFNSFKNNAPISEKVSTGLKTVSGLANVAFSPITALFQGAEQFPVLGTIAKAVSLPFTALGDAGSHTAITALNTLPIPEQDKSNLKDAVGEISGLAFQILGGKAFSDVITSDRVKGLQDKFGKEGADTIINTVKEKVANSDPIAPQAQKATSVAPEAVKPTISPDLQPLAKEAQKYKSAEEFVNSITHDKGGVGDGVEYSPAKRLVETSLNDTPLTNFGFKPNDTVTVWRGVDRASQDTIQAGDYIATSKDLAQSYTGGKVISQEVPASSVRFSSGDGITAKDFKNGFNNTHLEGVYNPTPLIKESQLTDIYNQATKGTNEADGGIPNQQAGFVNPNAALESAKQALEKFKQGQESAKFGESLRTFFTGERDVRVAETNQFRDTLEKLVPDAKDQEALTFMRDFRNKTEELQAKLDEYKASDNPVTKKLIPVIEKALDPTEQMQMADKAMTNYFTQKLQEGKSLGFLDSKMNPDEYITHLLQPENVTQGKGGLFSNKIGRNFQFNKSRTFDTVLQAVEAGIKPKTLNALDALTIYGDKHATASATKILINELKTTDNGKWGFRNSDSVPKDWVELSPGKELFRNRLAMIDKETGKASPISQNLYVPEKVADALKPIIEPSSMSNLPGFRAGRMYQAYLKSVQLGLSIFHIKALNITALNNEGITGVIKSYANDLKSPEFLDTEKSFIRAGGTTSILGRTIEAYREARPTALPTRMELLRSLPGIKQLDAFSAGLTKVTFDVVQRKFKVTDFALKDASWIAKNPEATMEEHFTAQKAIAKEVNSVYGGLQWENIGIHKGALDMAKFLVLAPDWTFSNFLTGKYALEGGAAGKAARAFWIRSAITGTVLTQGMSLLMSGQLSKDPTSVYMGKDKEGKEIYTNMFFAGATSDFINLYKNISDYGVAAGFGQTLATKGSPIVKGGIELLTNRNYLGQPIVPKGMGPIAGTGRSLVEAGSIGAPIPFSVSNIYKMLTDPKKQYSFTEYLTTLLGTKPRHVVPSGQREITSGKKAGTLAPATARTPLPLLEQIKTGKVNQPVRKKTK